MMHMTIVGYSHYGFTNDQGKYIEGYKFHVVRPSGKNNFQGMEAVSISVSEQMVQQFGLPELNKSYAVTYDQNGKLASYKPTTPPAQTKIAGA